jgi:hypothetical protein
MDGYRLRVRIGAHQFSAEGDKEQVDRWYTEFLAAVASVPAESRVNTIPSVAPLETATSTVSARSGFLLSPMPLAAPTLNGNESTEFEAIYSRDDEMISLSVQPHGENATAEAALLILYGYKIFRNEDQLSGYQLVNALKKTGFDVPRVDRVLDRLCGAEGQVIKTGVRRGTKYRLSNRGLNRAKQVANDLRAQVP